MKPYIKWITRFKKEVVLGTSIIGFVEYYLSIYRHRNLI